MSPRHLAERAGDPARAQLATRYKACQRPVEIVHDPDSALDRVLVLARINDLVCVTGSLYLVGHLRNRWFPVEDILSERRVRFLDEPHGKVEPNGALKRVG